MRAKIIRRIKLSMRIMRYLFRYALNIRSKAQEPLNYHGKLARRSIRPHSEIPRKIWIYWDADPPKIVKACIDRIARLNSNYSIHVLNRNTVSLFVADEWILSAPISPQLRSDLIRLYLLFHHGGIWIDGSVMLFDNLDWITNAYMKENASVFGYYRSGNTYCRENPIIETWLLAAIQGNKFISLWLEEVKTAIRLGPSNYLDELKKSPSYDLYIQGISNPLYLVTYVACQRVMQHENVSFVVLDCDRSALAYQLRKNWCRIALLESLALMHAPEEMPKMIKLVKEDRRIIDMALKLRMYKKGSILDFFIR